ncbi:MAG: hypothetical protein GXY53_02925, partial [Desulfobulbus sp.]|nr:hypothetical protein [Desulfobulbus sp.]
METISITCNGIQFFQIEKCIRKMFAAMKRPSGRKQYTEGMRDLFILMFRCTNGRDFTYLSLKRMEEELAVHPRTVERWLKKFIEDGWIAKGAEFVDGYMRHGFFLLAHPTLLKVLNNITGILLKKQAKNESENRQVVGNLPAHLTIRSSNEPTPPLPPSSPHAKEFASDIDPNKERKQINQDLFTQDETDCHPIWIQARSKLVQKNPHHSGILQLFTGRLTPSGLVVEGPNPIIINMVERNMGQEIGEVMQELGISSVSFGIQPAEIIK